ncbi:MAG TPA: flotillin family protein [Rhodothermia bacterium]|nr:flotillin family protein [Rhodothermia bacterium]
MQLVIAVIVGIGLLVVALFVIGVMIAKFYRKVEQGKALIVNKMKAEPEVTFTGATVLPIIHKAEVMDISVKTIEIDRRAKDGLICRDNIRADIKVTFFVRVNKTVEDVIKVAQSIGCARASDPGTLEALFSAKFSEGLKTVGKQLDFVDLYTKRHEFRDAIINLIGRDLNGYVLEDAAIDYLEQTPIINLDPMNILDAQGIRKITDLTSTEHVKTNEFQNTERKLTKKQDVEAAEAIYELERQQADALAKQQREIESVRAREAAELLKIQAEERLRSEHARIAADEEIAVAEQNKQRQVEVAQKNRERVVGIEHERVEKDRVLEQVSKERAVELSRIDKEKALEVERKAIQDVIRERITVEKSVVEEEERIKTLRVVEDANRNRQAVIIAAEAEAQERLVKDIKAAEAAEQAATHQAKERVTLAEAELEAADREARASIRRAEGEQARAAASGLAEAKVKEADAAALAKLGTAEASVLRDKALAEAQGIQEKATAMKELDGATREHEEFRLRLETERSLGMESIKARLEVEQAKAQILGEALKSAKIDIVGGDGQFLDRLVNSVGMGKAVDSFIAESTTAQAVLEKLGVKKPEPEVVPPTGKKLPVVRTD